MKFNLELCVSRIYGMVVWQIFFFSKYGKKGSCTSSDFLQRHLSDSYNKSSKVVWKFNFGNILNVLEEFSTLLI